MTFCKFDGILWKNWEKTEQLLCRRDKIQEKTVESAIGDVGGNQTSDLAVQKTQNHYQCSSIVGTLFHIR